MASKLRIIILAAGQGKRMKSDLPKPLHQVGGKPTLLRILEAVAPLSLDPLIVVGNQSDIVIGTAGSGYRYAIQAEQRGTGHAVLSTKESIGTLEPSDVVMVLPGDHPLITTAALKTLLTEHRAHGSKITICTLTVPDFENEGHIFSHHGRIRRDAEKNIDAIVEVKDATEEEKKIPEVNVGIYCFDAQWLFENLPKLTDQNAAGELYITDLVGLARKNNIPVRASAIRDAREAMGFNTPEELADIERYLAQLEE